MRVILGNDNMKQNITHEKGNSQLLVLLVTCLIISLFVVLAFFLVRLRKAHIAWKKGKLQQIEIPLKLTRCHWQ